MLRKQSTICIVPIKLNSIRVKNKNFRKVKGIKLYEYFFKKLCKTDFDKIIIDSDSKEIEKKAKQYGFQFLQRVKSLTKNSANGNDLLNYHAKKFSDADYYFQLFITAPLLRVETINNCISILKNTKKYDSILTVEKMKSWFWYKNKPVNFNPNSFPRSQDAVPLIKETTGLYGIKKNALLKYKRRTGNKPFFQHVSFEEGLDLDTEEDFLILKKLI